MGLDPSLVEEIRVGALLHELGKGRGVLFKRRNTGRALRQSEGLRFQLPPIPRCLDPFHFPEFVHHIIYDPLEPGGLPFLSSPVPSALQE